ncbi:MAG: hypothetical protein QOH78_1924 [Verrucomicrobiota bacterium]
MAESNIVDGLRPGDSFHNAIPKNLWHLGVWSFWRARACEGGRMIETKPDQGTECYD